MSRNAYWGLVLALFAFGIVAMFSIGFVFLAIGVALVVLSPFRSSPRIFRTGMALVVGFLFGFLLLAPWSCSTTAGSDLEPRALTSESCHSLLGIGYSGSSLTPGLSAGGTIALIAASVAFATTDRQDDRESR